jgi:hypothetical protein
VNPYTDGPGSPSYLDAVWLAELTECGLLRGSFIPPPQIAAIRELTRYRKKLIEQRTSELQRLAKVLEDSGIKIDSVASALTTLSARDMIEALIAGERDPAVLADLARGRMRTKIPELRMACAGRFGDQHALMCVLHLEHIDHLVDMIARLDTRIDEATLPFARQTELLATIPGIGERAAQVIISEIGVDMSRFPTAAHLASWAGLCPGNNESAGRHRSGRTRKGNKELCNIAGGPPFLLGLAVRRAAGVPGDSGSAGALSTVGSRSCELEDLEGSVHDAAGEMVGAHGGLTWCGRWSCPRGRRCRNQCSDSMPQWLRTSEASRSGAARSAVRFVMPSAATADSAVSSQPDTRVWVVRPTHHGQFFPFPLRSQPSQDHRIRRPGATRCAAGPVGRVASVRSPASKVHRRS